MDGPSLAGTNNAEPGYAIVVRRLFPDVEWVDGEYAEAELVARAVREIDVALHPGISAIVDALAHGIFGASLGVAHLSGRRRHDDPYAIAHVPKDARPHARERAEDDLLFLARQSETPANGPRSVRARVLVPVPDAAHPERRLILRRMRTSALATRRGTTSDSFAWRGKRPSFHETPHYAYPMSSMELIP
jgi:hypothetical protein